MAPWQLSRYASPYSAFARYLGAWQNLIRNTLSIRSLIGRQRRIRRHFTGLGSLLLLLACIGCKEFVCSRRCLVSSCRFACACCRIRAGRVHPAYTRNWLHDVSPCSRSPYWELSLFLADIWECSLLYYTCTSCLSSLALARRCTLAYRIKDGPYTVYGLSTCSKRKRSLENLGLLEHRWQNEL